MKLTARQATFSLIAILLSGCGLFENEQNLLIECTDKDLSNELLHVGISDGFNSRIVAYNAIRLEKKYQNEVPRGAPFQIHYDQKGFYYTISISAEESAFIRRRTTDGARLDSISVPKGATLFQLFNDAYVSYAAYPNPFTLVNREIVYEKYDYLIQPIQKVGESHYTIYGDLNEVYFGAVDTLRISKIANLTDIITEVIPNYSFVYGMYYMKNENRLLMTVEDYSQPPVTFFFDINLNSRSFKTFSTGQHANIIPSENNMFFFLTHASSLRLNSKPTQYMSVYSVSEKRMFDLIDFQKELGESVYIQDIASDGCSIYAGVFSRDLGSMILKYNIGTKQIDELRRIGDSGTTITSVTLTSNPKPNGELK